jgi:hypothetical protein
MVSFTLLYFDSRVRKEAYDLELLALDVAPGFYWQPAVQAGPFGYQMPATTGQGRAYVQTGPLGLGGYSTARAPMAAAPSQHGEQSAEQAGGSQPGGIKVDAGTPRGLQPDQGERLSCEACGAPLQPDVRFCSNCGSSTIASTS